MERMHWQDWTSLALGIWLVVSPWVLGFSDNGVATWNAILFGLGVVALELADVYYPDPWPERVGALMGVWVAVSPIVLGFSAELPAAISTMLAGLLIVALGTWTYWTETHKAPAGSH